MPNFQSLFETNREVTAARMAGRPIRAADKPLITPVTANLASPDLVGFLNPIHPARLHVLGHAEVRYYSEMEPARWQHYAHELQVGAPIGLIIAENLAPPERVATHCRNCRSAHVAFAASGRDCHRGAAHLFFEAVGTALHDARRLHGCARYGCADLRRIERRQKRARSRTDQPRPRSCCRRRGRFFESCARYDRRSLPASARQICLKCADWAYSTSRRFSVRRRYGGK